MKVGTKSLLFGAHQVFIHPLFVAIAWWKLYGFPWDPRLWVAFIIHDWGYWGQPNMDGPEGELHPVWAGDVMAKWFGEEWGEFCHWHSRFLAKQDGVNPSRLCAVDKLAVALEPWWLYLPRAILSGEIHEYMHEATIATGKYYKMGVSTVNYREWFADLCDYLRRWVDEHKDGRADTWTPAPQTKEQ